MNKFRTLYAREIDCRVSQISQKGLTLLLYKDARCDMNILDETVGAFNWKREHTRDNANCVVSIYDPDKQQWVYKEDTGTESNTEAEKGLASDSFKRACVNWGIGRELYSAPFIWVSSDKCKIEPGKNGKLACYDRFEVESIEYDQNREISSLVIINSKTKERVFSMGGGWLNSSKPKPKPPKADPVEDLPPVPSDSEAPPPPFDPPPGEPMADVDGYYYCDSCHSTITQRKVNGSTLYPKEIAAMGMKKYGKQLCWDCAKKLKEKSSPAPEAPGLKPITPTLPV